MSYLEVKDDIKDLGVVVALLVLRQLKPVLQLPRLPFQAAQLNKIQVQNNRHSPFHKFVSEIM